MKGYVFKRRSLKMTSLHIVFDAGSRLESDGRRGTMHLMEHLVCKTFKDMYGELSKLGISWNAYTSEECVTVFFKGLDKYLTGELKEKLYRKLTGGLECVTEEEFESERSVVVQEYLDFAFDSEQASWLEVMRRWWGNYMTIGRKSDIESFTHADMLEEYEKHFRKPARIVEVGRKRTDFLGTVDTVEPAKETGRFVFRKRKEIEEVAIPSEDKTPVFAFSRKRVTKKDYPYLRVGLNMLTYGLESPFYKELREKLGLTYYVYGTFVKNTANAVMCVEACTDSANAELLKRRMSDLFLDAESLLTEERYGTVLSGMKIEREMNEAVLYDYVGRYASISGLRLPNSLDKLTYDKVVGTTMRYIREMRILTARRDDDVWSLCFTKPDIW